VPAGSVLALLGPNGAGKTTAVSILTTLVRPDDGSARVAGFDVVADPGRVRQQIGLSGQYAAVDPTLTGLENLVLVGQLYRLGRRQARRRAVALLEQFSLTDAAQRMVGTWSGGMRRRLDLAGAIVAAPPVLFLDEPTTGLDPRSRNELWAAIDDLVDRGTTVLLTTQYMEEAEQLADDIVVIDHGRAIASGTADQLKAQVGGERIELVVTEPSQLDDARRIVAAHAAGDVEVRVPARSLQAPVDGGVDVLTDVLQELRERQIGISDVGIRRPTLDDVFLTLTGHAAEPPPRDDGPDDEGPQHPARQEVPA